MARRIMDFPDPDRFATGTVGEPGNRTFFLQAVQGVRIASVVVEKAQVALLAERLMAVVAELERRGLAATDAGLPATKDERPLDEPLREDFRVGTLIIAWDDQLDRLVVEARSLEDDSDEEAIAAAEVEAVEEDADEEEDIPDDAPIGPDVLRVRLTPAMAQQFARRAVSVVAAGRLPCPFCGQPIDRSGHLCPRRNGSDRVH